MIEYPSSLPRPLYEGHVIKPDQPYFSTQFDYAQKNRARYFGSFPIEFVFNFNETQLQTFNAWFYGRGATDLNSGAKPFNASWIILGIEANYEFQFAQGGQPSYTPTSPTNYRVPIRLNLLTDISEIIALNSLDGWCPEIIDCQRDFLISIIP